MAARLGEKPLTNVEKQIWEQEVVYAEILEYAKKVIPKFKEIFATQREIEQAELNR